MRVRVNYLGRAARARVLFLALPMVRVPAAPPGVNARCNDVNGRLPSE